MDTSKDPAVSDVPAFRIARVGKDRRRKGGAFSFLRSSGGRGGWGGAAGGSGAAGAGSLGMGFTKTMLAIMLTGGIGSAAIYSGSRGAGGAVEAKKPALFSPVTGDVKIEGDVSNLPSNSNTIPNSLGYLSGNRDGLTPEERAKQEAEAAAAAEAQRLADEEAAKKAEPEEAAGKPADPAALLASAQADGGKPGALGKKFGALSTKAGGGSALSGGAGLSGGVARQFGSSGSVGKALGGKLAAAKGAVRPTYARASRPRTPRSRMRGIGRDQLTIANSHLQNAAQASTQESASDQACAIDGCAGAGTAISGAGTGAGAGSSTGADSTPNPGDAGGPTGAAAGDCGANNYMDADGACKAIPVTEGKNVTPYQWMYNLAVGLLAVVSALSMLALVFDKFIYTKGLAEALRITMIALGGIIAALGVAILAMTGDKIAGGVLTLAGGAIAYLAYQQAPTTVSAIKGYVLGPMIAATVGGFAAAMTHKPAAAAQ
ncbi:MAG: hypothetical protein HY403_02570 [Elusimicrobia bacterium]|nr:hypothetical protein [Elusimicrobiota bacterium]